MDAAPEADEEEDDEPPPIPPDEEDDDEEELPPKVLSPLPLLLLLDDDDEPLFLSRLFELSEDVEEPGGFSHECSSNEELEVPLLEDPASFSFLHASLLVSLILGVKVGLVSSLTVLVLGRLLATHCELTIGLLVSCELQITF